MIDIIKSGVYYSFVSTVREYNDIIFDEDSPECDHCATFLNPFYIEILKQLGVAGLLPENFKALCCTCYDVKKALGYTYCKSCGFLITLKKVGKDGRYIYYCPNFTCEVNEIKCLDQ